MIGISRGIFIMPVVTRKVLKLNCYPVVPFGSLAE
jgi:hypothetical protein